MAYDPLRDPDPRAWTDLDEDERLLLIQAYHQRSTAPHPLTPNPFLHAGMHDAAENLLAAGRPEVRAALDRLMAQGLDRHEAIHAIASVVSEELFATLKGHAPDNARVARKISELTAEGWRSKWAGDEAEPELEAYEDELDQDLDEELVEGLSEPDEALYPSSQGTVERSGPRVGRNDPCPCGSGKTFKKCHGA